jgi:tetratricopeptide (TPR) repeat protein
LDNADCSITINAILKSMSPNIPTRPATLTAMLLLCLTFQSPLMAEPKPEDIKLNPYQEAFVAYKSGKLDDALARTNDLLAKPPNDAALLLLKGRILIKQGKYKESQDSLFQANGLNPELHEVHYYLGESAFLQAHWGEAVQYYRVYLSKAPGQREALLKIIYCYLAAGDLANSSKLITGLDPADDQSPAYYFARAALAFATDKPAEYQEALQQARTIYGNDVYGEYEPDLLFTLKKISVVKK